MVNSLLLGEIKRIKALSETGLLYCRNEYDKERYLELQEISYRMLNQISDLEMDELKGLLPFGADYPTVKVDIRALIISADNKILLVQESADGKWSLPGGWADIGYSAKETIVKECQEETGLEVLPVRLLAVFDKKMHPHPPQPFYVFKMVFHCKMLPTAITKSFDVLDIQFFNIHELPPLSEDRILQSQILLLHAKVLSNDTEVYVD